MSAPEERPMQVVARSLAVLRLLAQKRHGLTLQQLHEQLGIPLGSMHRILSTLEVESFVERSPKTKRYVLGADALRLGPIPDRFANHLVPTPEPVAEIASTSGETVFLTRLIDSTVVCIALVESVHHLRLFVQPGQEVPLHAAASARVILAYRDPVMVEALLSAEPRRSFTPGTVREVNQLIDHLDDIRATGYDVCDSELDEGVWAVAAPVYDREGRVEHGVTLAAAKGRVEDPAVRARDALLVLRAAERLSRANGFTGTIPAPPSHDELERRFMKRTAGAGMIR
jgi:IclR family acetate operon transcriptional repressor